MNKPIILNKYKFLSSLLILVLLLAGMPIISKAASPFEYNKPHCEVEIDAPSQYGSSLTANASVNCPPPLYLPYLRMCIYKHRRFRPDQEIACTTKDKMGDIMGGIFSVWEPWDKTVIGECQGEGKYYTRIRWFEGNREMFEFVINPPSGVKAIAKKGIKWITQSKVDLKTPQYSLCD